MCNGMNESGCNTPAMAQFCWWGVPPTGTTGTATAGGAGQVCHSNKP